jgi:hypothetical protein
MTVWAQNKATNVYAQKIIERITFSKQNFNIKKKSGGVAQLTSHPHQEREDPGSNPARV